MTFLLALSLTVSSAAPQAIHQQATQYLEKSQYVEAALLCQRALSNFSPQSLEAAAVLRDLSRAYRGEGYLNKAATARRQEMQIVKARLGEEDPNIALAEDGLGEIYYEQGRLTQARKAFEAALRIGEKTLEPDSPHLATILNDLGATYAHDGRYTEAAYLFRRSLTIRESGVARANLDRVEISITQASRR